MTKKLILNKTNTEEVDLGKFWIPINFKAPYKCPHCGHNDEFYIDFPVKSHLIKPINFEHECENCDKIISIEVILNMNCKIYLNDNSKR